MGNFFLRLFNERSLAPITIKGYQSMLLDTFKHLDLWDVDQIKILLVGQLFYCVAQFGQINLR